MLDVWEFVEVEQVCGVGVVEEVFEVLRHLSEAASRMAVRSSVYMVLGEWFGGVCLRKDAERCYDCRVFEGITVESLIWGFPWMAWTDLIAELDFDNMVISPAFRPTPPN